ncbi:hypothetical protein ACP70R_007635 [Stipagrostis hirtigluma subsp. patula]
MSRCTIVKSTPAAVSSDGEESAAPKGDNHAAAAAVDVTMAAAATATAEAGTGGEVGGKTRLSQDYVSCILNWKLDPIQDPDEYYRSLINDPLFSKEYVERSTEIMRDMNDLTERYAVRFEEFRAWVRAELEEKGYVEVDDDYIARRVQLSQAVPEDDWDEHIEGLLVEGDEVDGIKGERLVAIDM